MHDVAMLDVAIHETYCYGSAASTTTTTAAAHASMAENTQRLYQLSNTSRPSRQQVQELLNQGVDLTYRGGAILINLISNSNGDDYPLRALNCQDLHQLYSDDELLTELLITAADSSIHRALEFLLANDLREQRHRFKSYQVLRSLLSQNSSDDPATQLYVKYQAPGWEDLVDVNRVDEVKLPELTPDYQIQGRITGTVDYRIQRLTTAAPTGPSLVAKCPNTSDRLAKQTIWDEAMLMSKISCRPNSSPFLTFHGLYRVQTTKTRAWVPAMVMELLPNGTNLGTLQLTKFPINISRRIARDLTQQLDWLHCQGFNHGRVTANNVWVNTTRAVLVNLHCETAPIDQCDDPATTTATAELLRTLPEHLYQVLEDGSCCETLLYQKKDIYDLGELLAGFKQRQFNALVERAMEPDIAKRATAKELLSMLN
jgi:hypothetical protein